MQNPSFADKNSEYYTRDKAWIVPFIRDGENVILDLGCASGRLGRKLLQGRKAKEMLGVEIFAPAAAEATQLYHKVYVGDIEQLHLDFDKPFDYVICGDILEHLKDPYSMVKRIHAWLKPGGSLLACVPNVRNFRVLGGVIFRGNWEYQDSGILDRTHLRFFTKVSCCKMLEDGGFRIDRSQMIIYGPKKKLFNRLTFGMFAEFLATQVFCVGTKAQ